MLKARYFVSAKGCSKFRKIYAQTRTVPLWISQILLQADFDKTYFAKVTCLKRDLTHRYQNYPTSISQVPLSLTKRSIQRLCQSSLLENLRKLQQASVRAMSDIFRNLYNALADTKRIFSILRKDFLNFSQKQINLLL